MPEGAWGSREGLERLKGAAWGEPGKGWGYPTGWGEQQGPAVGYGGELGVGWGGPGADAEWPGGTRGGAGEAGARRGRGGSTWLISGRRFNIYEVLSFESQVFGSSYKELRHPPITW